jgi:putative NIF3 family GTP cyclohydrolase 1 type 2
MNTFKTSRRHFLAQAGKGAVAGLITWSIGAESRAGLEKPLAIRQVIHEIIGAITPKPLASTVDTVKLGDPDQPVTGIVTTFLATCKVLQAAADRGANLVISHEPVFYNHLDETEWLKHDRVYNFKKKFIEDHNLVIWRCHDYVHMMQPDPIVKGLEQKLQWGNFADAEHPGLYHIPQSTVAELAAFLKQKLGLPHVQMVGDRHQPCVSAGILVGAPGGRSQIEFAGALEPDVLICGEINEWETNIYVQDAAFSGRPQTLILLGHCPSEDAGMAYFSKWLGELMPQTPVGHVNSSTVLMAI